MLDKKLVKVNNAARVFLGGVFVRQLLWLLAIFSSTACFTHTTYLLSPEGTFTFVSHNHGPYRLSDFHLQSYKIYTKPEGDVVLYGTIEKLNEWTRTYVFKVAGEVMSVHRSLFFSYGSLLDCLKEYEIRDNGGILIGYIEGKYDTDARAEFLFFNDRHELFAKASVHRSNPRLTICSSNEQTLVTGVHVLRNVKDYFFGAPDYEYFWIIQQEDSSLDPRLLWPFVGFIGEVWWEGDPFVIETKHLQ